MEAAEASSEGAASGFKDRGGEEEVERKMESLSTRQVAFRRLSPRGTETVSSLERSPDKLNQLTICTAKLCLPQSNIDTKPNEPRSKNQQDHIPDANTASSADSCAATETTIRMTSRSGMEIIGFHDELVSRLPTLTRTQKFSRE